MAIHGYNSDRGKQPDSTNNGKAAFRQLFEQSFRNTAQNPAPHPRQAATPAQDQTAILTAPGFIEQYFRRPRSLVGGDNLEGRWLIKFKIINHF